MCGWWCVNYFASAVCRACDCVPVHLCAAPTTHPINPTKSRRIFRQIHNVNVGVVSVVHTIVRAGDAVRTGPRHRRRPTTTETQTAGVPPASAKF